MARCFMCIPPADVPASELFEHLENVHDIDPDDFERWPDGELIVVDDTLEPIDFEP